MKGKRREMREAPIWVIIYPTCTYLLCVYACVLQWLQQCFCSLFSAWLMKINVFTSKMSPHSIEAAMAIMILSNPKWSLFPLCELFLSLKQQPVFLVLSHCTISPIPACFCWPVDRSNSREDTPALQESDGDQNFLLKIASLLISLYFNLSLKTQVFIESSSSLWLKP